MSVINFSGPTPAPLDMSQNISLRSEIKKRLPEIMISALSFIAALAWYNAFQGVIDAYTPTAYHKITNAWLNVLYAFILTLILIILIVAVIYASRKI
jgi:uncharacterized membrane protein